mgnify:CR=1 FL=1
MSVLERDRNIPNPAKPSKMSLSASEAGVFASHERIRIISRVERESPVTDVRPFVLGAETVVDGVGVSRLVGDDRLAETSDDDVEAGVE